MLYLAVKRIAEISLNGYEYLLDEDSNLMKFSDIPEAKNFLIENGVDDHSELVFEWNFIVYEDKDFKNEKHLIVEAIFDEFIRQNPKNNVYGVRDLLAHFATHGAFGELTPKRMNLLMNLFESFLNSNQISLFQQV